MDVDQSATSTGHIPLRHQPMKNKRGGVLWGPWVEWIWGFKKKTRVNSRGCGKSKWLLKVYLFTILFGKLTYQWHMRKDTHHSIRKVACCQLKLNVAAAETELRIGSHASGLVLSSKEPSCAFKNGQNQNHGYNHSSGFAAVPASAQAYGLFCVWLVSVLVPT